MKRIALTLGVALTLIGGVAALAIVPAEPLAVSGSTATHVLYVDGTPYNHTQESGPVIHFETGPIEGGEDVTFPERDQVWEGNGSDNLPCEFGAHWVSNANLLTLSHCLDGPDETTTTVPASTTTVLALPGRRLDHVVVQHHVVHDHHDDGASVHDEHHGPRSDHDHGPCWQHDHDDDHCAWRDPDPAGGTARHTRNDSGTNGAA
jgi:hypothetical protein